LDNVASKTWSLSPASEMGTRNKKRTVLRMVIFNPGLADTLNVNLLQIENVFERAEICSALLFFFL
jgi:hypothetical protein